MANALAAYKMRWKIENISQCWWLKKEEGIKSPTFISEVWEDTKWSISLYPKAYLNENYFGLYLRREIDNSELDVIEASFQLAFLDKDGSILKEITVPKHKFLKNDNWGFHAFERRERILVTEREAFLPEDTLSVQCTMWILNEMPDQSNRLFATTALKVKRKSFVWKIHKPSTFQTGIRKNFKNNLIDFNLVLNDGFDKLEMDLTSLDDSIKYISCNTSIIDFEGGKESCGIQTYLANDIKKGDISTSIFIPSTLLEDESRYFPNGILSFVFEFVISTVQHSGCKLKASNIDNDGTGKEKPKNISVLNGDFKSLYDDGIFSDIELRTSTKIFNAHKAILSARSPVFRNMFSHDMKEKNYGYVDITDFEADTIHQMLQYIYTDSIENLEFDSTSKLYAAADKYQILSLKEMCSSFLKENLHSTNVCDALVLADLHNDDDLKSDIQDYILTQHKEVFCSQEWKNFMNTHLKLAADLMYRKISNSNIHLQRKRKSDELSP